MRRALRCAKKPNKANKFAQRSTPQVRNARTEKHYVNEDYAVAALGLAWAQQMPRNVLYSAC